MEQGDVTSDCQVVRPRNMKYRDEVVAVDELVCHAPNKWVHKVRGIQRYRVHFGKVCKLSNYVEFGAILAANTQKRLYSFGWSVQTYVDVTDVVRFPTKINLMAVVGA